MGSQNSAIANSFGERVTRDLASIKLSRSEELARVELVNNLLSGRNEYRFAIQNRPGFLGVTRLVPRKHHSWIHIERNDDGTTDVLWTSGKDSHQALWRPAYSIGISTCGQVISLYQSALSMWMKYHHLYRIDPTERERAEAIAGHMFDLMRTRGVVDP